MIESGKVNRTQPYHILPSIYHDGIIPRTACEEVFRREMICQNAPICMWYARSFDTVERPALIYVEY